MVRWLKRELLQLIPVVVFFFVAFSLVDITVFLMHRPDAACYDFVVVAVAACLMGKVVLISDKLLFGDIFSGKPLIYSTIWKTFVYTIASLLIRILDHAVRSLIEGGSWGDVFQVVRTRIEHLPFWVSQAWLAILLLVFVAYRELVYAVGVDKVKKLFFNRC